MRFNEVKIAENHGGKEITTYFEAKIDKRTLCKVTSVYTGKINLATALEDFTINKIVRQSDNKMVLVD